ncbi:MAG: sulfotransferase [Candidatus Competibacteraceae bacterium]
MLDFLGIGAQKAGTTWLYHLLARHPQVGFPAGKELHFWNRPHDAAALDAYLAQFPERRDGRRQGEITPAYALLDESVIRAIHAVNPHLRLIYLIRNPTDRAWSSALMALTRAELTLAEASDRWFIDHFQSAGSRARGDYQACLQRWCSVFPSEQLLLLRYERIAADPVGLLDDCFRHLGVEPASAATLIEWGCRERIFAGPGEPLRPSLRPVLRRLYRDRILALAAYLREPLDDWLA